MIPLPPSMVPPSQRRPSVWRGGVLQIFVTRSCDKSCYGCTQGSNLSGRAASITPEQFRVACRSLMKGPRPYFGVIGMFGGNPCAHPKFEELCQIFREEVPDVQQRGLWSNNPLGKGKACRETFFPGHSNLNVHMDQEAYSAFKRDWPESMPFGLGSDSRHSPVYVALKDVIPDEQQRWDLIADCDVNQRWSAMIGVFRGELRGYFCEIAGAQAMLRENEKDYPDTGVSIVPGWWDRDMKAVTNDGKSFELQSRLACHDCGVPLRGMGQLAVSDDSQSEQVSATWLSRYSPKRRNRNVELVTELVQVRPLALKRATDYVQNSKVQ